MVVNVLAGSGAAVKLTEKQQFVFNTFRMWLLKKVYVYIPLIA